MPAPTTDAVTTLEQRFLHEALESCERRFDDCEFFGRLASGDLTPAALKYVFGQYGHFRLQLHRWFAVCIILTRDASQPAQREAILALSDHIFTDLRDGHDLMFAELLHELGFPAGTLHSQLVSPATTAYIESFLVDSRAPTVTWVDAIAALGGRELSVVVRNKRLLKSYFAPRGPHGPTWLTLHADLEIDHFLDIVKPVLKYRDAGATEALLEPIQAAIGRHAEYLDALLREHENETTPRRSMDAA